MNQSWRSLLFVPTDDDDKLKKAVATGVDAVILDLEDGVLDSRKDHARSRVADASRTVDEGGCAAVVRINDENGRWYDDLLACVGLHVSAVMVPKAEDPDHLIQISKVLDQEEERYGFRRGRIGLLPLIESPKALLAIERLLAVPRVLGAALGSEDFSLELGVEPSPAGLDLPCRLIALAASMRRQMALAVPASIALFREDEVMTKAARLARSYGATGALCIHPAQVQVANACFSVPNEVIDHARRIIAAWDAANNEKAVIVVDGSMVDRPVVARARRVLAGVDVVAP